ncbi:putative bifunctional diguanylate cyclase/phosphodiesterase [Microbacterium paludicola]|uniref:putative bifunctional diguanylate cyclase/phosphodiesterase n=1 Tax=Microbacterium paludicola TaxID=300019 RepID=UPI00142FCCC1|nr:EAL domain-containing protein [Microbacterium paludicola]MBF0815061.1 EAL domain-containing protein [Microbacterium paludicola]
MPSENLLAPPRDAFRRVGGTAAAGTGAQTVGDLSTPVPTLAADTPILVAERRFRDEPTLRAVAVAGPGGLALLTLRLLETQLSGRLGYGRALLSRAVVGGIVDADSLVLESDAPLLEAAEQLLTRVDWLRDDEVLVMGPDGEPAVASVSVIFREVGLLFRDIAMRDQLTGLPNRRLLHERGELLSTEVDPSRMAVLYVDLDGFKQINDSLGHKTGDELLVEFARRLNASVRPQDLVGRLGGDEFAVLLTDVGEEETIAVADRIIAASQESFLIDGLQLYLSASVGVVTGAEVAYEESSLSVLDTLLQRSDVAMLHAKRAGKARIGRLGAHDDMASPNRPAVIRRRLGHALEQAAQNETAPGVLSLHYQPKLDLHSGEVESVEALLRWNDSELGQVSPAEFIPVAEHTGQIRALGSWVLRAACRQAREWMDQGHSWTVAINVSPVQLGIQGFVSEVLGAVRTAGIPTRLLQIEVTESSAIGDVPFALEQLADLRTAGVRVHLDDFGTGYSSLARLRHLPLDALKIDQSITGRIDSDEADAMLLAGVIGAAHLLGLTVIAEGVERDTQFTRLSELGCDVVQGYLIGRPSPAGDLPRLSAGPFPLA